MQPETISNTKDLARVGHGSSAKRTGSVSNCPGRSLAASRCASKAWEVKFYNTNNNISIIFNMRSSKTCVIHVFAVLLSMSTCPYLPPASSAELISCTASKYRDSCRSRCPALCVQYCSIPFTSICCNFIHECL